MEKKIAKKKNVTSKDYVLKQLGCAIKEQNETFFKNIAQNSTPPLPKFRHAVEFLHVWLTFGSCIHLSQA
jgi:hypothetical protein